ncbi:MAG TPA: NTP transferase domain-containing protein [Terracidiphilus sp.]|nr:NTP transferase domain-containing protein [Terracidiphilus sp.]
MVSPTLLVLAAGTASRYRGVKVVEPVGPRGETLLEYSLYDARKAGFGRIIMVVRRDIDRTIRETLGARLIKKFAVEYVHQDLVRIPWGFRVPLERTKPWGTTHAVLCAASLIHEPFAVINVDDFYGAESYRALASHLQAGTGDYAMIGFVLRNTLPEFGAVARGICRLDESNLLTRITEIKNIERRGGHAVYTGADGQEVKLSGDEVVSMNMWGFTREIFKPMAERFEDFLTRHGEDLEAECYLSNTVDELLAEGKVHVKVLHCADCWFGVTYRDDYSRAVQSIHHMIDAGYYPRRLWT